MVERSMQEHQEPLSVPLLLQEPGRNLGSRLDPFWRDAALCLLVGSAGLVARLHGLGAKPYWLDEVTTLRRAALPFGGLVRDSLSFHHLPLYFIISSWFVPLGLGEQVMRLPAALFGAACCMVLFLLGRSLGGWRTGLAASLLLAFCPFQVQYGQEARSYTLVTTLILVGLWGLVLLARDPAGAARPLRARPIHRGWLLYGAGTALALDTLSVATFWFLAANLAGALMAVRSGPHRYAFVRKWLVVQLLVLATYLPFVTGMWFLTHGQMGSGLDWVPPLTGRSFWSTLQSVYLLRNSSLIAFRVFEGPLDVGGIGWFGLGVTALAATGAWMALRRGSAGRVVLIAFVALPAGLLAVSAFSSVWMPRYLLWSGPIFFLLAGIGLHALPVRAQPVLLVALGLFGVLNLLPYYRSETKPVWNEAAALLQHRKPGDIVITDDPGTVNMMNLYLARTGQPLAEDEWTIDPARARAHEENGGRVWGIHGTVGQNDPYRLTQFLQSLEPLGAPRTVRQVGLDITLLLFDPNPDRG